VSPVPGAHYRPGHPGWVGPYETRWRKLYDERGRRCIATYRRVGDRQADVVSLAEAQWRVTITPVAPKHGTIWLPCGTPVELGIFGGRKAGRKAADEYLESRS
jgi:hypothetical protein